MEKATIRVEGMACEHCVNAVTKAVEALPGVASVSVSLADKAVTVEYGAEQCALETIQAEIEAQGYDVIG